MCLPKVKTPEDVNVIRVHKLKYCDHVVGRDAERTGKKLREGKSGRREKERLDQGEWMMLNQA